MAPAGQEHTEGLAEWEEPGSTLVVSEWERRIEEREKKLSLVTNTSTLVQYINPGQWSLILVSGHQ